MRIKAEWGSLSLAEDGDVILCAKCNGAPRCVRFSSLEELKQAINEKKVRIRKWAVAVPRSLCILKALALPASDLAEASRMIEFEVPSLVPLPTDEIVYGLTLLSRQDNMSNVLVCILKLSTLDEHLEPYKGIGIEPCRITLSSLAIQCWFNTSAAVGSDPIISALIHKGKCAVQTCINGNLQRASEMILTGQGADAFSQKIVQEMLHQREELPVSMQETVVFLLAGTGAMISEIEDVFGSAQHEPSITDRVSVVPNPRVLCYAADAESENGGDGYAWGAVVASGLLELAVHSGLLHSNLVPRQYARREKHKQLLFRYLRTGSLLIVLIVFVWLCLAAANWRLERICREIQLQIAPIEHSAALVEGKRQRVSVMQQQLSNRRRITAVIDELYRHTPKTISISELRFVSRQAGASIEIKGQADLLSTAFSYTDAMRKAQLLNNIQIENAQQIARPGGSVVVFKAICDIR